MEFEVKSTQEGGIRLELKVMTQYISFSVEILGLCAKVGVYEPLLEISGFFPRGGLIWS